ncbi:MAG: FG-GAP-like repeat-containing protein [Candidatus Hodarchaeota archaeon]
MTKTVIVFFFAIIIGLGNNSEFNKKKNFIIFKDETANSGLEKYTPSFGAVFADIDMDGDDDLIVSNHGHYNPSIYLNDKDSFRDVSHLFRLEQTRDWHGITVVDLDNDGDKDIAIAGGGGGGVQAGAPNLLYQNLLKETGNLDFIEKAGNVGMIRQKWRGRHFLPVGNMDGSAVDLYFICKPRENLKNLYFRNTSFINRIEMKPDNSFGLDLQLPLDGRGDCFLDFDRDGDRDFFAIDKEHLTVFENINNHFFRNDTQFVDIDRVETFRFGDLNKDGYPDLYIGTKTKSSGSDNISAGIINDDRVLHFVVSKNGNDNRDRVEF